MKSKLKKEFVGFELALKVKGMGFNEPCLAHYDDEVLELEWDEDGEWTNEEWSEYDNCCMAPLWQQVLDWLGTKYNFHIVITVNPYSSSLDEIYGYKIYRGHQLQCVVNKEDETKTKTKIVEEAILEVIRLITGE